MMPLLAPLIAAAAATHGLPVNLVKALCHTESAFDPWAFRHEAGYRWLVGDKLTMSITERIGQMSSWGLMQVMGAVAREYGYAGPFPQLCDPVIGLEYGCRHFARYVAKYPTWPDAIASYNAGSPRKTGDVYVNQTYVDKIYRSWNRYDLEDPPTPSKGAA